MATMSIRTNDERKYSFEGFCESIGITVTAAVNMFMNACLREENQKRLRTSLEHAKQGKLTKHEISEVE